MSLEHPLLTCVRVLGWSLQLRLRPGLGAKRRGAARWTLSRPSKAPPLVPEPRPGTDHLRAGTGRVPYQHLIKAPLMRFPEMAIATKTKGKAREGLPRSLRGSRAARGVLPISVPPKCRHRALVRTAHGAVTLPRCPGRARSHCRRGVSSALDSTPASDLFTRPTQPALQMTLGSVTWELCPC